MENVRNEANQEMGRRARAYREELQAEGIMISFTEAVDAVNAGEDQQAAFSDAGVDDRTIGRRAQRYHVRLLREGIEISFAEAVDAVNAGEDQRATAL